jgi:hypothetical protein
LDSAETSFMNWTICFRPLAGPDNQWIKSFAQGCYTGGVLAGP